MPSLNFDYTQFLKRQNALYLLKYQNDPVEVADNPAHINGYSGHVPSYRGSIHEQRAMRSLVRCLTSPMKPTTAMGYSTESNRNLKIRPKTSKVEAKPQQIEGDLRRAQSAPPPRPTKEATDALPDAPAEPNVDSRRPNPSRLSMVSAGSSDTMRKEIDKVLTRSRQGQSMISRGDSRASSISYRQLERRAPAKHPAGYPQTLYGASYWFAWPDEQSRVGVPTERPKSNQLDRELGRNHDVIYHKHEGVLPKYMGYVPGYKFRHGATYGVLTVHAVRDGAVHRRLQAVAS